MEKCSSADFKSKKVVEAVEQSKRTRGRPPGNPKPLNPEEKRQRNAQYERERREEMADAMRLLKEANDFTNTKMSNHELLARVTGRLRQHNDNPPEDISELERINKKLKQQIAVAEARLMAQFSLESSADENFRR